MNRSKTAIVSIILIFAMLFAFAGCKDNTNDPNATTNAIETTTEKKNYTIPDTPVEIITEQVTFEKLEVESGEFKTNPDGSQIGKELIQTVGDLEIVQKSYYVYRNSVATIESIDIEDNGLSFNANAYARVKITQVGNGEKEMKIAYKAYDAEGNVVRNTYMLALLDGVNPGDVVEDCRIDIPRESVRLVFENYSGK